MKLISWNVNGIRAVLTKGELQSLVANETPDILCLQETKAREEQVELPEELASYRAIWNSAEKAGYSGTAMFCKNKPLSVSYGIGAKEHDNEGRVITAELENVYLVTVYTPNSKSELSRLPYRQTWDAAFLSYIKSLEKTKPVVFCGDLNVAHKEIDLARPKINTKSAGFTAEERSGFDNIVDAGFVDTFRHFSPDTEEAYTWWSYRGGARKRNVGWRIDYFCVSDALRKNLKAAAILSDQLGSDHCPVTLELSL